MANFTDWLQNNRGLDGLEQAGLLRSYARDLGAKWPQSGVTQEAYNSAISEGFAGDQPKIDKGTAAIRSLWTLYQSSDSTEVAESSRWRDQLISNLPTIAAITLALFILMLFGKVLYNLDIYRLAEVGVARGLLMFLFGMTTVGIALLVAVMVFLGTATTKDELGDRFQRGKDILTVLIGVFGAILGYYFGSDKVTPSPPPPEVQGEQNTSSAAVNQKDAKNVPAPSGKSGQATTSDTKPPGAQNSTTTPNPALPAGSGTALTESR